MRKENNLLPQTRSQDNNTSIMTNKSSLQLQDTPSSVRQTDFSPSKGNALQACVASLFHQPLEKVPNFVALECGYEQGIQDYLITSSPSYSLHKKGATQVDKKDEKKLCILRGKSPRGDFGHVVIARVVEGRFTMIHDPHPDDTFLDPQEPYGWYMVFE